MSHKNDAAFNAVASSLFAGGLVLAGTFAAASLAAPAQGAPAPAPVPAERNAILPERIRIPRNDEPSFPDGWLPRPR